MDQGATWYGGRPRPRRHYVRWKPSSPRKGAQQPSSTFRPTALSHGRPSQQLLSSFSFGWVLFEWPNFDFVSLGAAGPWRSKAPRLLNLINPCSYATARTVGSCPPLFIRKLTLAAGDSDAASCPSIVPARRWSPINATSFASGRAVHTARRDHVSVLFNRRINVLATMSAGPPECRTRWTATGGKYRHCVRYVLKWNWRLKGRFCLQLERCNPWPHVANRHISISQLLSLIRHSHYDLILIATSFANELATPTATDVRALSTDTLPRLVL